MYPELRWIFNKILFSEAQGLPAYPHGIEPVDVGHEDRVFSKPITNLWGLSTGARIIETWSLDCYRPGHFWTPVLPGPQLSTDVVVDDGEIRWRGTMAPTTGSKGSFLRWDVAPLPEPVADIHAGWCGRHLRGFRGVANIETRGRWVIEAPPRMAPQFLDFYGADWLDRVVAFYSGEPWVPPGPPAATGVSWPLRLPADDGHRRLWLRDRDAVADLERDIGATVYLPWQNGQRLADANDDDHSYRFAIVNATIDEQADRFAHALLPLVDGLPEGWCPSLPPTCRHE